MVRQCRAKLKSDNGEYKKGDWVYGYYVELIDGKKPIPCIYGKGEVYKETVGEEIGLLDKNGEKLFSDDIVRMRYNVGYGGIPSEDLGIGIIKYYSTYYGGASYHIDIIGEPGSKLFTPSLEVTRIGNMHDNPELLEGAEK